MKTTQNPITTAVPNFSGIVIDPLSGRKCALQIDLFKGLGLAGSQITATGARVHQNRFYDLLDVLEARKKVRSKKPPVKTDHRPQGGMGNREQITRR